MIRVYAITKKKLYSGDIASSKKLDDLSREADWLWIDCLNLDEKEIITISNFFEIETKTLKETGNEKKYPSCERYKDSVLISIPFAKFGKTIQVPISLMVKDKTLVTLRDENSTTLVRRIVETLENYLMENGKIHPSFVVSRLFREVANENSKVMMNIKKQIDKVEEEALERPRDKSVTRSVLKLKKEVFALHRLLWFEKELMSDVKECVVPHIKLSEESKLILEDAIDDIQRELEFEDSYSRTLDGILRLQDLGLIHRVERTLIYLTILIILLDIMLIVLEVMK